MGEAQKAWTCRLCGGTSLRPVYRQAPWTVARCTHCGHYSTVPWPTDAELESAYSAEYYREFGMWAGDADEASQLMAATVDRIKLIERLRPPPGRLIEIGTATGPLVAAARARGWEAIGYDTSQSAVDAGQRLYGPYVRLGDIQAASAEQSEADVLVAYHVLEHVPDPRGFLSTARAMLRDSGVLVIEVPHVGSFDTQWLPEVRLRVLDLPRHLSHFTPATLAELMREVGLAVVSVDGTSSRLVHRLRSSVARSGGGSSTAAPLGGRPGLVPRLVRRVMSGSTFCIYARKVPA